MDREAAARSRAFQRGQELLSDCSGVSAPEYETARGTWSRGRLKSATSARLGLVALGPCEGLVELREHVAAHVLVHRLVAGDRGAVPAQAGERLGLAAGRCPC